MEKKNEKINNETPKKLTKYDFTKMKKKIFQCVILYKV